MRLDYRKFSYEDIEKAMRSALGAAMWDWKRNQPQKVRPLSLSEIIFLPIVILILLFFLYGGIKSLFAESVIFLVGAPVEIAIGILGFVGLYKVFKERRNERIGFTSQSNPTLSFNLVHKSGAGQYFRDYAVDEKCYKNSLCIHPNVTTKTISIF